MDEPATQPQQPVQQPPTEAQPQLVEQPTPASVPSPSPAKKKLSQNAVNLIITSVLAIFLLFHFLFPAFSNSIEQIRLFVSFGNNPTLLVQLLAIRFGLAYVFLWYGIDNYTHPEIFNNLANVLLKKFHLEKNKHTLIAIGYVQAITELFVAFSLMTGMFLDLGTLLGSLLLMAVLFAYEEGLGSLLIRDIGLLGAMISMFIVSIMNR
jgi:hypothetical protein